MTLSASRRILSGKAGSGQAGSGKAGVLLPAALAAVLGTVGTTLALRAADKPPADPPTTSPATAPAAPTTKPADTRPTPTGPTAAATTAPTTTPASQPAAPPKPPADAPNLHTVQRGNLSLDVQGDGLFQPVDPYEVRIVFKAYPNPLTITRIAAQGSAVKKGDVLIEFDPTAMNWMTTGAESELAAAKAGLVKTESDNRLGEKADQMNLRMTEDAVKNADDAVKWWSNVDGPQMLENADLMVKFAQHSVEDQNDELDQLHKMYKDEELTSATADIVVKRAVRQLEQSKIALKMQEARRDKIKEFDYPINKAKVIDAAASAHQQLDLLKAAQAQNVVSRQNNLVAAKLSVEQATRHMNDIKEDQAQFSVKSPTDGTVIYGQIVEGVWANADPKAMKVGEKVGPGVLMRVYTPGKMQIRFNLPDNQAFWVEQGMKAKVVPVATPQESYEATCGEPEASPHGSPPVFGFQTVLHLPEVDRRIEPGMKAAIHIQAGKLENVLLIPVGAVTAGKVKVHKDGHAEDRDVVLGKSDGQNVEVRSGLNEGEQVVLPGKK